ncbi:5057_t:CDS:1, partial [Racocetra persica]
MNSVRQWVEILKKNREKCANLHNPILSCFQMYGEQKFMLGFYMLWQFKLYEKYYE